MSLEKYHRAQAWHLPFHVCHGGICSSQWQAGVISKDTAPLLSFTHPLTRANDTSGDAHFSLTKGIQTRVPAPPCLYLCRRIPPLTFPCLDSPRCTRKPDWECHPSPTTATQRGLIHHSLQTALRSSAAV